MANTANFGWETPDDTDLVKDGAASIRTLGSAIDSSMVDLKGGTTGQVLSKTSNTDMDFTWVTTDDANAIQNAIVDAKGDLITATAADTPARLAVGTNGQYLIADSTTSTGLKWANGGKVLQVVEGTHSTAGTSTSSTYADTGLTATITPSATSSKILVVAVVGGCGKYGSDTSLALRLQRGSTTISTTTDAATTGSTASNFIGNVTLQKLDSPSTTSATTYKVQYRSNANSTATVVMSGSSDSSIVLMEIGA